MRGSVGVLNGTNGALPVGGGVTKAQEEHLARRAENPEPESWGRAEGEKVQQTGKPWGYELLIAHTQRYAGKILAIRAGQRLSLQHHRRKEETLFLLEGEADLEWGAVGQPLNRRRMDFDRSYRIRPGERHRLIALTDARVLEVSSPELGDVVRWEDDYGRAPERYLRPESGRRRGRKG